MAHSYACLYPLFRGLIGGANVVLACGVLLTAGGCSEVERTTGVSGDGPAPASPRSQVYLSDRDGIDVDTMDGGTPYVAIRTANSNLLLAHYATSSDKGAIIDGRVNISGDGSGNYDLFVSGTNGTRFGNTELTAPAALAEKQTALLLEVKHNGVVTPRRVLIGPENSAGSGYRALRILN